MSTTITDSIRAWARGAYSLEAGVELLIRTKLAGIARREGADGWYVDADKLLDDAGPWSGGEKRIARIAASLLGGERTDLGEDLAGLDREQVDLVLAAIAHAAGSHEHRNWPYDGQGRRTGNSDLKGSLHPWPENSK